MFEAQFSLEPLFPFKPFEQVEKERGGFFFNRDPPALRKIPTSCTAQCIPTKQCTLTHPALVQMQVLQNKIVYLSTNFSKGFHPGSCLLGKKDLHTTNEKPSFE